MEEGQSSSQTKADNTNFTAIDKDGQETFVCNICQKEEKSARAVKSHITRKHRERPADSKDDDPEGKKSKEGAEDVDDIDDDEIEGWANKGNESVESIHQEEGAAPASQQNVESSSIVEKMVIDSGNEAEGTLIEAVERLRYLEGEN